MTTAKTFAPILAVLAALPAADALCAPDRAEIQTRWLAGQIESARTTDNAAVERDAFRRLLSMSPDDAELALYAKGAPKKPTPVSPALEAIAPHVALLLVRRSLVFTLEAFGETDKAEAERRLLPEAWRL